MPLYQKFLILSFLAQGTELLKLHLAIVDEINVNANMYPFFGREETPLGPATHCFGAHDAGCALINSNLIEAFYWHYWLLVPIHFGTNNHTYIRHNRI